MFGLNWAHLRSTAVEEAYTYRNGVRKESLFPVLTSTHPTHTPSVHQHIAEL